jgi:hypothetical protein
MVSTVALRMRVSGATGRCARAAFTGNVAVIAKVKSLLINRFMFFTPTVSRKAAK